MASSTCFSTFFVTEEQPVNANGRTSKPIAILLFIRFSPLHGSFCMSVYVGFCKYYTTFHQKTQVFYRDFCEFVILFSPFSQYTPKPTPSESSKPSRSASAVTISAIGHIRLCKLQSHHLQSFYQNLRESGIKQVGSYAYTIKLEKILKQQDFTREAFAKLCGLSSATISTACKGKHISIASAEKNAAVPGVSVKQIFEIHAETSGLAGKTILHYHRLISSILAQAARGTNGTGMEGH
ncbi:MAG: helix-turn-helix transcriptional regulator [Oscillospiraceae bacterium]|nr:helix-turn-helix transcriptional regulator [Oscillospiraceae bacterium]